MRITRNCDVYILDPQQPLRQVEYTCNLLEAGLDEGPSWFPVRLRSWALQAGPLLVVTETTDN